MPSISCCCSRPIYFYLYPNLYVVYGEGPYNFIDSVRLGGGVTPKNFKNFENAENLKNLRGVEARPPKISKMSKKSKFSKKLKCQFRPSVHPSERPCEQLIDII